MHDVVVVGGGISGLAAAFELRRAGLRPVVLEESATPGGNIRTVLHEGYRLESGPHSFMGSADSVFQLIEKLGVEDEVEAASAAAANRYIYRDGALMPLPTGVSSFLGSGVLSLGGKLRLAVEPFVRGGAEPDETAWEFFRRRFGDEAATYIMSPFISGVYAGDIHSLGARAAFPKFWAFERDSGSMILGAMKYMRNKRKVLVRAGKAPRRGLFSMPGGLSGLIGALAAALGEDLRLSTRVEGLVERRGGLSVVTASGEVRGRSVVVAAPPHRAAAILEGLAPDAAGLLRGVPMVPVALVHWSCPAGASAVPAGFGFLVPRVTGVRTLGTLFPSQIFSGRAPEGQHLFASYYGGATDPGAAALGDDELTDVVLSEHEAILGVDRAAARVLRIMRHRAAIPQLLPHHPELIDSLRKEIGGVFGLSLAGNYLTGVGIEAAVESGFAAAAECRARAEGGERGRGAGAPPWPHGAVSRGAEASSLARPQQGGPE